MSKRVMKPKKTQGYGYAGTWRDGSAGWFMPSHIHNGDKQRTPSSPNDKIAQYHKFCRTYLCRITVDPVLDAKGRPITKIVKREGK